MRMCRLISGRYQKRNPQGFKTIPVHLFCIHDRISLSACSDKNKIGRYGRAVWSTTGLGVSSEHPHDGGTYMSRKGAFCIGG